MNRRVIATGRRAVLATPTCSAQTYGGHLVVLGERGVAPRRRAPPRHGERTANPATTTTTARRDADERHPGPARRSSSSCGRWLASALVGVVCAVVGTLHGAARARVHGRRAQPLRVPGRGRRRTCSRAPFYLGAAIAAVGTALAIGWVTRRGSLRGDTAIGVLFAGMFALGVFLFSRIPNYVGDLFGFLFGEVLAIGDGDLVALAALGRRSCSPSSRVLWKELLYSTFDPLGAAASGLPVERLDYLFLALIALTIVVSLQAVGIIMVVAMLVTPAATAQLLDAAVHAADRRRRRRSDSSRRCRALLSYWLDAASGATIVLVETAIFAAALLLGPRTGVLRRRAPRELQPRERPSEESAGAG